MKTSFAIMWFCVAVTATGYSQYSEINTGFPTNKRFLNLTETDYALPKYKMCTALKVGFICMGTGLVSFYVGLQMAKNYYETNPKGGGTWLGDGIVPVLGGIAVFGLGTGLAIGGGLYDVLHRKRQRLRLEILRGSAVAIVYHL